MGFAALSFVATTRAIEPEMRANKAERRFADIAIDSVALYPIVKADGFDLISAIWIDDPQMARSAVRRLLGEEPPDAPGDRVAAYVCPECADLGCGAITVAIRRSGETVEWSGWGYQNNYEDGIVPVAGLANVTFGRSEYEQALRRLLAPT